jgi:hypothetical protein
VFQPSTQPPRPRKVREITCRDFARENIFSDWSPGGHSSTFEKRSDEDMGTRGIPASLRAVAAGA